MSHANYQVISAINSRHVLRSRGHVIPRLLQQERIIKTIARILSALNATSTVVAFATACKALERPVLDVLWESQDDWFQLLKCFPPDVWEERDSAFVSCRPLSSVVVYPVFTPHRNPILALSSQSYPSGVGSFQEIRIEDGPYQHHAVAEINIDPILPNIEYGGQ